MNFTRILSAVLLSGLLTALSVLTQTPDSSRSHSNQIDVSGELKYQSNDSGLELGSGGDAGIPGAVLQGMSTALLTLDESTDETGMETALRPATTHVRIQTPGVGGLHRAELMAEANRIMLELWRDGVVTVPSSYACAFADMSPSTGQANIIIELYRDMHQQHLALVKSALTFGDQDSLIIRGWSQIRFDLAKMQDMATELRNETALAPGDSFFTGEPRREGFTHLSRNRVCRPGIHLPSGSQRTRVSRTFDETALAAWELTFAGRPLHQGFMHVK